jgi:hypothetical protein
MRILWERTGGFTGRKIQGSLESSDLPPDQVHRLQKLLDRSRFFEFSAEMGVHDSGADRFSYKVTIETKDESHTVEIHDSAITNEMRPFLDFLTRHFFKK